VRSLGRQSSAASLACEAQAATRGFLSYPIEHREIRASVKGLGAVCDCWLALVTSSSDHG
jgi:hypothetical protein